MSDTKITEKFEYLTNIITSYDGHEQRVRLRNKPRHYLTYDYSAMCMYDAHVLRGMLRMNQMDSWYLPMWHSVCYLTEDFIANGKQLRVDPDYMYNFEECDYIEIFIQDDYKQSGINFVRQVASYSNGIINLKKKIEKPLSKLNTFIYPLRKVSITPQNDLNYIYSNGSEAIINVEDLGVESRVNIPNNYLTLYDTDTKNFNIYNLPERYNNKEVFRFSPQWIDDGSNKLNVEKNIFKLDNDVGDTYYDVKTKKSYDIIAWDVYFEDIKKLNNIKKFFKRMCGKYKSFYMPSWVNDFQVDIDVVGSENFLFTNFDKLYQFYARNNRQKSIVIFLSDFTVIIRDIMSYGVETISGVDYGKLTLSAPIGKNLSKDKDIVMVSYLNLVRFDSDELQLNYSSNIVANSLLTFREVDDLE